MQRNFVEVQTNPNDVKVKPPHLVALNSTDESLTWQLEGLDPKIRIDKYQVRWSGTYRLQIIFLGGLLG